MDIAEDRDRFSVLLDTLQIPSPANSSAYSEAEAREKAEKIGYPVLVRPSYVLGGRAMEIVHDTVELETYMKEAVRVSQASPGADRFVSRETPLNSMSMRSVTEKRSSSAGSWNISSRPASTPGTPPVSSRPSPSPRRSLRPSGNIPGRSPSALVLSVLSTSRWQ